MAFKFSMDLKPVKFRGQQTEDATGWLDKFISHCELNEVPEEKKKKTVPSDVREQIARGHLVSKIE